MSNFNDNLKHSIEQVDFNCGPSSYHDFIKNYFLSNILKFPLKFSISSQPGWQAGIKEQLKSPCPKYRIKPNFSGYMLPEDFQN